MKKTKIEQRVKNAVNAFFDHDQENFAEDSLILAGDSTLLKPEMAARINEKGDLLVKILKRAFLFLPGAFYLFFGTISVLSFEFFWDKPWAILAAFLIGSFMTIFGIGNIKNPKHLMIPLSIVAVGMTAFLLFSTLGNLKYVFAYGIYFFPIALVVSFLAKNLADQTDDEKN